MRRYCYTEVRAYFQEKGYVLLSPKYNNAHEKLDTLCPVGHRYSVKFAAFMDKKNGKRGSRCSICCTINQKYSQEYIESFLKEFGYRLQEGETYKGVKYELNVICPQGHSYSTSFESFKRGRRCQDCRGMKNTKYTLQEARIFVEEFGYYPISTVYSNSHDDLHLICPEGYPYITTFDGFKNNGNRCRDCYVENLPKREDHPMWKGGESQLKSYIRGYLKDWKDESLRYYGGSVSCSFCFVQCGKDTKHLNLTS